MSDDMLRSTKVIAAGLLKIVLLVKLFSASLKKKKGVGVWGFFK